MIPLPPGTRRFQAVLDELESQGLETQLASIIMESEICEHGDALDNQNSDAPIEHVDAPITSEHGDAPGEHMDDATELDSSSVTVLEESSSEDELSISEDTDELSTATDEGAPGRYWRGEEEYRERAYDGDDPLIGILELRANRPIATASPISDSFDTDDTAAEDNIGERHPEAEDPMEMDTQVELHWSEDQTFRKKVKACVDECRRSWWWGGVLDYVATAPILDFEIALMHAKKFIEEHVQPLGRPWKVGITAHPYHRFEGDVGHAYIDDPLGYSRFTLLWECVNSRKELPDSSGAFEKALVDVFNSDTCQWCINRPNSGGECPARTSPNFCYVIC